MTWEDAHPHVAKALQYADDVVSGQQVAGKLVTQACQRFLDDLEREDFPFYFDVAEASRACRFIERLPHIKGEWAKRGLLITLEPWQCFIVAMVFGWRDEAGNRRFRTAYIEVARKNAKSTLAAGIALYMLTEDGEAGAEVYSSATTRNQAKIVFETARQMALRCQTLPIEVRAHAINHAESASLFEPLHAQGETLDGKNIHCGINDELHAWKKREVYDVIETAMGSRLQPLMFNITTAGTDTSGICWEVRGYALRILDGQVDDDSFFALIYTIDEDDDWTDRDCWVKANPNLNVSVYPMDLEALARKAAEVVSQQNAFLTKRLNVWTNAAVAWMNMRDWAKCQIEMEPGDFAGEDCWVGIDLASKLDITSAAQLFTRHIDGKQHVYAFMRHWLPEAAVEDEPTGIYDGWVRSGHIRTTMGNILDVDQIENELLDEVVAPFNVVEMGFDPMHNSTQLSTHMGQQGVQTVDVRPTVVNFSEAMKWLEAFVKDGRFHSNCPVLTWMIGNVEVKVDYKDNIYPRKAGEASNRKIDGVIALLIALNRCMTGEATYYPGEGVVII